MPRYFKVWKDTSKLRAVEITENIGILLFHSLTDRSNFVRLPGDISEDHPVLIGGVVVVRLCLGSSQSRFPPRVS